MSRYAKRRETAMSELMDSALSAIDDLYAHAIRIETQSDKTPEEVFDGVRALLASREAAAREVMAAGMRP